MTEMEELHGMGDGIQIIHPAGNVSRTTAHTASEAISYGTSVYTPRGDRLSACMRQ